MMPCVHLKFAKRPAFLTFAGDYKPGDPKPDGYLDRHDWARVQLKAGLRQEQCAQCSLWFFPFELSDTVRVTRLRTAHGQAAKVLWRICKKCDVPDKATRESGESPNAAAAGDLAKTTGWGSGPLTGFKSGSEYAADSSDNSPPSPDPNPDMCTDEARALGCTCRVPYANSASIDPPEPVLDPWCPVHGGRDPDYELQRDRDDKWHHGQYTVGKDNQ